MLEVGHDEERRNVCVRAQTCCIVLLLNSQLNDLLLRLVVLGLHLKYSLYYTVPYRSTVLYCFHLNVLYGIIRHWWRKLFLDPPHLSLRFVIFSRPQQRPPLRRAPST